MKPKTAKRPVNLDIGTFRLPITAYASISHRISGVIMLGGVLVLIYLLSLSLQSSAGFDQARALLDSTVFKLVIWGVLAALSYHLVAGIRHLLMDAGFGETREGGKRGAMIAFVAAATLIILAGIWVW